jgi:putative tryptophan/tyrosine transport system substrate-binding protein
MAASISASRSIAGSCNCAGHVGMMAIKDAITRASSRWLFARIPLALANCLTVYWHSDFARDGGLLSYGVDPVDVFRRAATYVDRILRGAKPSELPVQFSNKFELVINLKTAKALGLLVPPNLLALADVVIE